MAAEEEFPELTEDEFPELTEDERRPAPPVEEAPVVAPEVALQPEEEFPELTPEERQPLPAAAAPEPDPLPPPVLAQEPEDEFPEITPEDLAPLPPLQGIIYGDSDGGELINRTSLENFQDALKIEPITLSRGSKLPAYRPGRSAEESFNVLSDQALDAVVIPEEIMDRVAPALLMAWRKSGVIDYDQDTGYWWNAHPDFPDQSLVEPIRINEDVLRDIARRFASGIYNDRREEVRRIVRSRADERLKADALYGFMKDYYPSVAASAAKEHPFFEQYDFEDVRDPWYSSLSGIINVIDMAIFPVRKGFLELRNKAQMERVVEGQFELPGGLEEDYLKTNGGYKMANGNYLVPVIGRGVAADPEATPDMWPEDLKPVLPANAPMGVEVKWPEGYDTLDTTAIRKAGLPGRTSINDVDYWVVDPQQFRGLLIDDLHDHVSLIGKASAPLRWLGVNRGFTDTDIGEAWRRLGLRRFMRAGLTERGNAYLTGEHLPGFRPSVKVVGGVEKPVPFTEDLAKVFSTLGGPTGTSISDAVAEEAGKDISAMGALPYRGIQGLWGMRDEAMTDMAELVFPAGAREAAGEYDPKLDVQEWDAATQALAELVSTGSAAKFAAGELVEATLGGAARRVIGTGVGTAAGAVAEAATSPIYELLLGGVPEDAGGLPYDPEAGFDPLGNLTFELATMFLDPMMAPGAPSLFPKMKRMGGTVRHVPFPMTATGEKAYSAMTNARLMEAAEKVGIASEGVPWGNLSTAEQLSARRQALSDFSRVHAAAKEAGRTVADVGYETRNILNEAGEVIGTKLEAVATTPVETGVEMIGGIVPWTTSPRTQPMVARALKQQISGLADEVLGTDSLARRASQAMLRGLTETVWGQMSATDRILGTDWIRSGGGVADEAWGITRAVMEEFGWTQQEIIQFTKKFFAEGPDMSAYTPDDFVMVMQIMETNKDIILDERLLRAGTDVMEFIEASRTLENEVARGRFKVLVEDPAVRDLIEELHIARWEQKYNEIVYKLKHGPEREKAVQDAVSELHDDLRTLYYTMGRMERLAEIRGFEDEFAGAIDASERLIALALQKEKTIPPRFGKRAVVPDELTSPQMAEHLEDVSSEALDQVRRLEEEIEGLRRNLITETSPELRLPSALAHAPEDTQLLGRHRKRRREGAKKVFKEKRKKLEANLAALENERDGLVNTLADARELPEFPTPAEYWTLTGEKGTKPSRLSWEKGKGAPAPEAAAEVGAVEGPEFGRWFGESKVVDDAGEPLVVYHGTERPAFEAFDPSRTGERGDPGFLGVGSYFSSSPRIAAAYAGMVPPRHAKDLIEASGFIPKATGPGGIFPAHLSIKNPFQWGEKTRGVEGLVLDGVPLPSSIHEAVLKRAGYADKDFRPGKGRLPREYRNQAQRDLSRSLTDELLERGYDGVIARIGDEFEVVAFRADQVKSTLSRTEAAAEVGAVKAPPSGFLEGSAYKEDLFAGTDAAIGVGHTLSPDIGKEHGIFLTPRRNYARGYGENLLRVKASLKNPKYVTNKGELSPRDLTVADVDRLVEQGYDSVVVTSGGIADASEVVLFSRDQAWVYRGVSPKAPARPTVAGETRTSGNLVAHKAKGAKTWTLSHAGGEEVATGFKTAQDAQSWGEAVATYHPKLAAAAAGDFGRTASLAEHADSPLLNIAASYSKKGKMLRPWDPKGAWSRMGPVTATMDWAERARKAVDAERQLGALRGTIKTQKDRISAMETELGDRLARPSPYQDRAVHNRGIEQEISELERSIAGLDRASKRADREAGQIREKIDSERYGVQAVARSELRKRYIGEVKDLRKMARDARVEATRKRDELRTLLATIRGQADEFARARAAEKAILEFNEAAAHAVGLEGKVSGGKMSQADADARLKELFFPEDPRALQWTYEGVKKPKLTKKQRQLSRGRQAEILAATEGREVTGTIRAASQHAARTKLAEKNIEVTALESGSRTKLTQRIDDLQAQISEHLGIEEQVDIFKILNLTEDATPYEIVTKVLQHQDEAFQTDVQLARMIPGYNAKMDDLLVRLEAMTEQERFFVADNLKMGGRFGRYAGLTAEEERLRPVVEHIRKYFSEMLDMLQDHGILTDWKLYEFLDRSNISGYVHHMLSTAGFGLSGRARSLTRRAASKGRLQVETSPLMFRGIGGAAAEIDDVMKWIVGEQIVKHQARLGLLKEYTLEMAKANARVPDHLIEEVIKYFPEEFRYLEQNALMAAGHYSGQIAKALGNKRLWDDLEMVQQTFYPEATRFSASINDPKIVMSAAREAVGPGEEITKRVGLETLDRLALAELEAIYGVPFERVTGVTSAALVTGGKFPSGDTAILDALEVMVRNGKDPAELSKWLAKNHGIQITAKEAESLTRGHIYLPKPLADYIKSQLGQSELALLVAGTKGTEAGERARLALDVYDMLNNLFKGWVTVVWPRFHGRNQWGGMIQNAMIHGEISVRPEFQKKVIMTASKEGLDIPFTYGEFTATGREWQDILRRFHVDTDQGAVADIEKLASGHPIAGLQGPVSGQMREWAKRTLERMKVGESRTEVLDELIEHLYSSATMKGLRGAYRAEQAALPPLFGGPKGQVGRLKTGPAGETILATTAGGLTGMGVGAIGGNAATVAAGGLVGAGIGFLQSLASQKAFRLGGEVARVGENHLRRTNFFAGLSRGLSREEAAWYVQRAHFNYNPHGQSWFGYQVMRRAFPFWTWNSKNFKQHLWLMQNRPVEMAMLNKIMTGMMHHETTPELEAVLPPQLKSRLRFHLANGAFFAGFGTPFEAFAEMLRPMHGEGIMSGIPGSAGFVGLSNPWFLAMVEMQQDRSFFFDRPLNEIRSARDLQFAPQILQEFFGYDSDYVDPNTGKPRHILGSLDPYQHPGKFWIPDEEEAARRFYLFKRLDAFPTLLNFWYQARAEAYQEATARFSLLDVEVSPAERFLRMGLSWRVYHVDVESHVVDRRAYRLFMNKLMDAFNYTDRGAVVRVPPSIRKGGKMPAMSPSDADEAVREMMGVP